MDVSAAIRTIKANSSRWVRQEFAQAKSFTWQTGYAAFSVSQSLAPKVVEYIDRQAVHHAKRTFQEELLRLLDAHGIDYELAHVFD